LTVDFFGVSGLFVLDLGQRLSDLATLTVDLGGHGALALVGDTGLRAPSGIYVPSLKFVGFSVRDI